MGNENRASSKEMKRLKKPGKRKGGAPILKSTEEEKPCSAEEGKKGRAGSEKKRGNRQS